MVSPAHQLLDPLSRGANLLRVMVLVGKDLLLRQHDRNGCDALTIPVADRRGNAGHGIIGFRDLDRKALPECLAGRVGKRKGVHVGAFRRRVNSETAS